MVVDIYSTDKKYNIIYADPPWKYHQRATDRKSKFGYGACGHYDVMSMNDIENLPIPQLADKNCVLFL